MGPVRASARDLIQAARNPSIWLIAPDAPSMAPMSRTFCSASAVAYLDTYAARVPESIAVKRVLVETDRHVVDRIEVGVGEAVVEREERRRVDVRELPPAAELLTLGRGHVVRGAAADTEVVLDERGGEGRRTPDLLDLARVGVDLPDTFDRGGELGGDRQGEVVGVGGDVDHGHDELLDGIRCGSGIVGDFRGEYVVDPRDATAPDLFDLVEHRRHRTHSFHIA